MSTEAVSLCQTTSKHCLLRCLQQGILKIQLRGAIAAHEPWIMLMHSYLPRLAFEILSLSNNRTNASFLWEIWPCQAHAPVWSLLFHIISPRYSVPPTDLPHSWKLDAKPFCNTAHLNAYHTGLNRVMIQFGLRDESHCSQRSSHHHHQSSGPTLVEVLSLISRHLTYWGVQSRMYSLNSVKGMRCHSWQQKMCSLKSTSLNIKYSFWDAQ